MKAWLTRAFLIGAAMLSGVASADDAIVHDPAPEPGRDESAQDQDSIRDSVQWAPSVGRQCRRRTQGGRRRWVCDGPLRVPTARGSAAILSEELGLGTRDTALHLLTKPPTEEWTNAVAGATSETLAWPVAGGNLWRGFGRVRRDPRIRHRIHKGIDIGAPEGTPILAAADGIVGYSANEVSGYGNMLIVIHADGTVTAYAHCQAIYVQAGEQVRRGQMVGEVGTTGLARGPHLHFEYRRNGRPRNPIRHLDRPDPARRRNPS